MAPSSATAEASRGRPRPLPARTRRSRPFAAWSAAHPAPAAATESALAPRIIPWLAATTAASRADRATPERAVAPRARPRAAPSAAPRDRCARTASARLPARPAARAIALHSAINIAVGRAMASASMAIASAAGGSSREARSPAIHAMPHARAADMRASRIRASCRRRRKGQPAIEVSPERPHSDLSAPAARRNTWRWPQRVWGPRPQSG